MESLAVAQVAAAHGLPFVAVRVIVDTAADALPRAVVAASLERPGADVAAARRDCRWRLRNLVPLIRLAGRYRTATRSLGGRRARRAARAASTPSPCRMKALVTGATGFVGAAVAKGLERRRLAGSGPGARGLGPRQFAAAGRTEIVEGDLADLGSLERALEGCDGIVSRRGGLSSRRARSEAALSHQCRGNPQYLERRPHGGSARASSTPAASPPSAFRRTVRRGTRAPPWPWAT